MIKPLEDKVVVQPIEDSETKTISGLIVTSQKEVPDTAIVISAGPGVTIQNGTVIPIKVKAGDKVIYSKFSGTEVQYKSEKFLILSYRDIFAVIED